MSDINFNGRVAVVTGAGAGLGRSYAIELAKRGAKVVVNDLGAARDGSGASSSAADAVVDEIKKAGGQAVANYDSVASMTGGANIIKTAVDAFGKVDILINNAGILRDKTILKMTEEEWDIINDVHVKGVFALTQAAFKYMKENNFGRIIFTTSVSGLYGNFGQTNYAAAKMAQIGFMNALELEGVKYNIFCNAVAPNAYSRMTADLLPPQVGEKLKPEFNVPLVVYLSSEDCKDTGKIFAMGAGWFGRTEIVCGPGVCIGDTKRDIKAEEIKDNWDKIMSLDGAKPLGSGPEVFQFMGPLLNS